MTNFSEWLMNRDLNLVEAIADKGFLMSALEKGGMHKLKQILDKTNKLYKVADEELDLIIGQLNKAKNEPDYHSPYFLNKIARELEYNFNQMKPAPLGGGLSRDKSNKVETIVRGIKRLMQDHGKENVKDILSSLDKSEKSMGIGGMYAQAHDGAIYPMKSSESPREVVARERGYNLDKLYRSHS